MTRTRPKVTVRLCVSWNNGQYTTEAGGGFAPLAGFAFKTEEARIEVPIEEFCGSISTNDLFDRYFRPALFNLQTEFKGVL